MKLLSFLYSTLLSTRFTPYPIEIGKNICCNLPLDLQKSFIITNPTLYKIYHKTMKLDKNIIMISDGESYKSMQTLSNIIENAQSQGCDKHSQFVALGGGVIGDLTGLAANLYMRGIKFTSIPTTLMSMIDSSIGGKNGVNNIYAKNCIGTFYNPSKIIIDIAFLDTLTKREYQSGIAEMIKCAIIADADFFSWLEKNINKLLNKD
jgi:3-dehydroquinate synthase